MIEISFAVALGAAVLLFVFATPSVYQCASEESDLEPARRQYEEWVNQRFEQRIREVERDWEQLLLSERKATRGSHH